MKKQGESVIRYFFKYKPFNNHINEKVSFHRELSIDMVIYWGIFKTDQITLFSRFASIL